MGNKNLLNLIDQICEYIQDHGGINKVEIEGNKTTIKIKKEKKDESKID